MFLCLSGGKTTIYESSPQISVYRVDVSVIFARCILPLCAPCKPKHCSIFRRCAPGGGSDASAAGGRISELSEWQRSAGNAGIPMPRRTPGTATGCKGGRLWCGSNQRSAPPRVGSLGTFSPKRESTAPGRDQHLQNCRQAFCERNGLPHQ